MKKHRTGFLVLMLSVASALVFNSCDDDEASDGAATTTLTLPGNFILSNDGGSATVPVTLNDHSVWYAEVKNKPDWCRLTPASGSGSGDFVVTVEPNAKRLPRSIEVVVSSGRDSRVVTVEQKDTLRVTAPDNLVVGNAGDTVTVTVEANTLWEVIKPDFRANWVTFTPSHGNGSGEVTFIVAANPLLNARSVEIVFSAGGANRVIAVSQQDVTPTSASDSLALVALYHSTDGAYWSTAWELGKGIAGWTGVSTGMVEGELRVTGLRLPGRSLEGVIPAEIGNLSRLEVLDLSGNNIRGEIPVEIGELIRLKELNLSDNKFDGELPLSVKNLIELEVLDVQRNRFTVFPVEICQLSKLQRIQIEYNEIASLPGEITEMSKLEYLYLNNNRLTSLPKGLDKLPKLIYLHASHNQITELPEEIGELVNLQSLRLDDNEITGVIPAGLSNLVALKYLDLSGNQFSGQFPSDMHRMKALETIDASDCGIGGPIPAFGRNGAFSELTQILLSGNHLEGELTEDISNLTHLEWVYLEGNELSGTLPADALGNMDKLPGLTAFVVSDNKITGKIPAGLATRLSRWSPTFNKKGFRLDGNYLEGPVPRTFDGFIGNSYQFNFDVSLFPQRDGVVLTIEK